MTTAQLPALEGSEKQVAWATQIRQSLLDAIKHMEKTADESINGRKDETGKLVLLPVHQDKHESIRAKTAFKKEWLHQNVLTKSDAKFWIDNRSKNWMSEATRAARNV